MNFMNRCVLAAAVAATGLLAAPARAADLSPLLPAETESVVFINIRQILDSDLVKKYALSSIKQALEGNDAQRTMKELGLDPLRDIDQIHGGLWGEDAQDMKGLFVIKGKFDLEKLFAAAEREAARQGDRIAIVKDGEYSLVRVTIDDRPDPIYVSGADKNTLVVGTERSVVTAAMQAAEKPGKPALKKELAELAGRMDPKASLFVAGVSSGNIGDIPPNPLFDDPEKLRKQLEKLVDSSMTLKVTGDVNLDITMGMKDADAADDFGATVDDLLTKAKAFLPFIAAQAPQAKPIVNDLTKSLTSKVEKNKVVITAKLSGDAIGRAVGTDD
jgi:hypothetical protein